MSSYEETSSGVFDGIIEQEFPLEDLDAFSEGIPEAPDRCKGCKVYGQAVCDIIDRRRYIAGEIGDSSVDSLFRERLERMYTARTGERYESDDELISKIECMTENCLGVGCELGGEDGRTPIAVCGSSEPISD